MNTATVRARERKRYPAPEPDPDVCEKLQKSTGWGSIEERIFGDIARLTNSGKVQTIILFYVRQQHNNKFKPRKAPFTYEELAAVAGCQVRDAQIMVEELARPVRCEDGEKRSVLVKKNLKTGSSFHLQAPIKDWPLIPSYPDRKPIKKAERSVPQAEQNTAEEVSRAVGFQRLPKVSLQLGARSEDLVVKEEVKILRFESAGYEGDVKPVVKAGVMTVRIEGKNGEQKEKKLYSSPQSIDSAMALTKPVTNGVGGSHGCGLAKTLAEYGIVSDRALKRLVDQCQSFAPGCSLEEIEAAAKLKAATAGNGTKSMAGLILGTVPELFASSAYKSKGIRAFDLPKAPVDERRARIIRGLDMLKANREKCNGS